MLEHNDQKQLKDKPIDHKEYIDKNGEDLPEIRNWKWNVTAVKTINL
jgi:xylulose-5-phosphate/fructose-6-phosphate phosphoketolase